MLGFPRFKPDDMMAIPFLKTLEVLSFRPIPNNYGTR